MISQSWNLFKAVGLAVVTVASIASGVLLTRTGPASGMRLAVAGILIVLPGAALVSFALGLRAASVPRSPPAGSGQRKEDAP